MEDHPLNLLKDYALLREVAADLSVNVRTIRRRIHHPDHAWPHLIWGGKLYLHVPSIRKILEGETRSRFVRGDRKVREGAYARTTP